MFNNRRTKPNTLQALPTEFPHRYLQKTRYKLNFSTSTPDITFPRPGTAVTTPTALKMQSPGIPGPLLYLRHLYYHFRTAPVSALVAIDAYFAR
jgi:hypothetical protein